MGLQTDSLHIEIAAANLDLYPFDRRDNPHWGSRFEQLVPFLARTGIRNFEIHPTKTLVADAEQRIESGDTEIIERTMGSLHQTFNDGTGPFGKVADLRGVYRELESIPAMRVLQTALSRPVPSVHLPKAPTITRMPRYRSRLMRGYPGTFAVMQPAAEAYRDFYVTRSEDLETVMAANGIIGLCPDTVHARRRAADGSSTPPIEETWAEEFRRGRVFQMHVATDRADMAKRDPLLAGISVQEYKLFTSGSWHAAKKTQMGEMIIAAIENWVPPKELAESQNVPILRQVIEMPPLPKRYRHRVREHAQMAINLAEIARETGANVLLWGDEVPQKPETAVK